MQTQTLPANAPAPALATVPAQFLTFTVGAEEYGVDIMIVREVKGWAETTRLPNTPVYMRGVLNLRGIIIPIFDLRARFAGETTQATEKHVVVILAVGTRTMGLLVDTVSDILTVGPDDIKNAPESHVATPERFVNGLIALDGRMVVLLDVEKLVAADASLLELQGGA
ncbi:MAG: chemotaxis protein CheW [Rickettsiales bacterium]|nr:chemotaxis protein CheW [Rickettsiales bacterium]